MIRVSYALLDAWMDSYPREPEAVTLDIDDTRDVVHGHQQLSLFNPSGCFSNMLRMPESQAASAHYDERCVLPIHIGACLGA